MSDASRREMLKSGLVLAAAPALLKSAPSKAIKVGLVGCGGRGTGAAAQALKADDYAELTAVADIDQERVDQCLNIIKQKSPDKMKVEPSKIFLGLDAYQKLLASDVDVVLLATPPGFRPAHLQACIEANKHVFCEKPVSTDAPGCRQVMEAVKLAKQKNLSLVSGFCWRYNNMIMETFDQLHNGAVGKLVNYYGTYYTGPVKPMPPEGSRPSGMSDVEWQIRNWYNFVWTCGDGIVEQAIHTVDKVQWAMKDVPPLSCVAIGGRQIPNPGGNIYDHFEANYLYPGGVRAAVVHRQITGCYNENADYIQGTEGTCTIGRGRTPKIEGAHPWTFDGKQGDMYQLEHDALFAAIRKGQPINNGERMTLSTMVGIMGRMAAYTGEEVTWDQVVNSNWRYIPEKLEWDMKLPVEPMASPGQTKLL